MYSVLLFAVCRSFARSFACCPSCLDTDPALVLSFLTRRATCGWARKRLPGLPRVAKLWGHLPSHICATPAFPARCITLRSFLGCFSSSFVALPFLASASLLYYLPFIPASFFFFKYISSDLFGHTLFTSCPCRCHVMTSLPRSLASLLTSSLFARFLLAPAYFTSLLFFSPRPVRPRLAWGGVTWRTLVLLLIGKKNCVYVLHPCATNDYAHPPRCPCTWVMCDVRWNLAGLGFVGDDTIFAFCVSVPAKEEGRTAGPCLQPCAMHGLWLTPGCSCDAITDTQ